MDLNMLVSDFHIMITTSRKGSKYDDYFSRTVGTYVFLALVYFND